MGVRFGLAAMLAAGLIVAAAQPLGANCNPAKTFTNFNTIEEPGAYYYIHWFDASVTSAEIFGRFWQTGDRAAANEGAYDDADWLVDSYYYPGQDRWYLNGNLGDARVAGCPAGSLTVTASSTRTGGWFMATIDETPPRSVTFDFSRLATDFNAFEQRLQITGSSRQGVDVVVSLMVPNPQPAVYGTGAEVTSIGVYATIADRGSIPSRDVTQGNWVLQTSVGGAGGHVDVVADCADPATNQFLAMAIEVDGVAPTHVGIPREIECNPNLADPRFRLVAPQDKPGRRVPREN